jgi:5-methylcytosine-specific restriction endonuclease McrA
MESADISSKFARYMLEIDDSPWYIPDKTKRFIIERDNSICRICKRYTSEPHIDHIDPVSKGGKCFYENLQVLCPFCNLSKSNHALDPKSYEVGYVIPIVVKSDLSINKIILERLADEYA